LDAVDGGRKPNEDPFTKMKKVTIETHSVTMRCHLLLKPNNYIILSKGFHSMRSYAFITSTFTPTTTLDPFLFFMKRIASFVRIMHKGTLKRRNELGKERAS